MIDDLPCDSLSLIQKSRFSELFRHAEEAIKIIEHQHTDLIIPSVNELRYAGYHLAEYFKDINKRHHIDKACGHCKRAIYDAYEAGILYCSQEYNSFCDDYKDCTITNVIPDYVNKRKIVLDSLKFISLIEKKTKANDYKKCQDYYSELLIIIDTLNSARDELNKVIKKERLTTQVALIAVLTLIATVIGFLTPCISLIK